MKIKIKLESLENILNLSNSFCTIPIIMDKSMMFGAYGVDLNMSEYIWYQLPEECKNKIYNYKEHTIKAMIITLTNISAYSVSLSEHEKFKEPITMEEFYKDFSENKKIERFLCECDFPYSNMSVYFQSLGEIYKSESISLEKIEEEQESFLIFIGNVYRTGKLSEEYFERFFSTYPLILRHLDAEELVLIEKNAEELGIEISDNIKYEIGYSLTNTQTEIMIEEEKEAIEEIRKKWNLKKVYED